MGNREVIIFSSSSPQIAIPAVKTAPQGVPWSVIVESEYASVFNALSAHCHSPNELKENGYIVHPYNPSDYANSRKCKQCNCKFLPIDSRVELNWDRPRKECGRSRMYLPPIQAKQMGAFYHTRLNARKYLCFEISQNPTRPYKCCSTAERGCRTSVTHDFQIPLRAIKHEDF
jgi:hypothetical protein